MINTIALTGASGMLGRHISHLFAKKKIKILATSRNPVPFSNKHISWKRLNLATLKDTKILDRLFKGAEAIVHAGALVPKVLKANYKKDLYNTNVRSTYILSKWAQRKDIHLIFISGAIVYKKNIQKKILENCDLNTRQNYNDYGFTKQISDVYFNEQIRKGHKVTVLRPSSIYGWGLDKNKIINKIIRDCKKGKALKLYKPFEKINFIHAKDVATAIFQCIKKKSYDCYNIGSENLASIEDISKICRKINKNKSKIKIYLTKKKLKYKKKFNISSSLAKKELDWSTKIILKNGLSSMQKSKCE